MRHTRENVVGLDFETYGSVNLPDFGLDNYVADEFFTPLIASVSWFDMHGAIRVTRYDFVEDYERARAGLGTFLLNKSIVAHNAGFEWAVLDHLGIYRSSTRFIDSAVIARAAGAGGKLEAAAPQLLGVDKMAEGWPLIKLFSIPGPYQEANGHMAFDPQIVEDHLDEWFTFKDYCDLDAILGLRIWDEYGGYLTRREWDFNAITMDMNKTGWYVDLDLVKRMKEQYEANLVQQLNEFHDMCDPQRELNLNSTAQIKKWCAERGVKSNSFDKQHVDSLVKRVEKRLETTPSGSVKYYQLNEVRHLLVTKQILGGSSLKKLDVILRNTGNDGRLRDQYLHCGAGQTLRTSGRSAQMQNLKRLGEVVADVEYLMDGAPWSNQKLAENLRQNFCAAHPDGTLIVGDFSSVESRGLAYLAGAEWKLNAFRKGKDMYKVLASQMFSLSYDAVTKPQRQTGKVGELSCGYGAGPLAVQSFAAGMGVEFTEGEATKLVQDWRAVNPEIVEFWNMLDEMLHQVVEHGWTNARQPVAGGKYDVVIEQITAPATLLDLAPGSQSIEVRLESEDDVILKRYFHGCYVRGRNICFWKPSENKNGPLWKATFVNPKTKREQYHSVYGGKLAGILTQSFCREIFFWTLRELAELVRRYDNLMLVGQFHDEIVVEWRPVDPYEGGNQIDLAPAEQMVAKVMSSEGPFKGFPLAAEIKHDYRYTK